MQNKKISGLNKIVKKEHRSVSFALYSRCIMYYNFRKKTNIHNINAFLDVFVAKYFVGSFLIDLWNHFDTKGLRTYNHIEGYNMKLKHKYR